jgi:hypothetical protein
MMAMGPPLDRPSGRRKIRTPDDCTNHQTSVESAFQTAKPDYAAQMAADEERRSRPGPNRRV